MNFDVVSALKDRYTGLSLLLVSRSVERAQTESELFDILESVPSSLPVRWNSLERRWLPTTLVQKCIFEA